jgi:hypothetical protein
MTFIDNVTKVRIVNWLNEMDAHWGQVDSDVTSPGKRLQSYQ